MSIPDIQNINDDRGIPINQVGIDGLFYPIVVKDKEHGEQQTIAEIGMFVYLDQKQKGTHMSRFIEVINENRSRVNLSTFPVILRTLKVKLQSNEATIKLKFPYFITKASPETKLDSISKAQVILTGHISPGDIVSLKLSVAVTVTSLCPCSKEISEAGAHNQRAEIRIVVDQKPGSEFIWIEELIECANQSASCPVYSLLKRPDEKAVTETAYNNPMFVEDMVRSVAEKLDKDPRVAEYQVHVTSYEFIHDHNAYAFIRRQNYHV